MDGVAERIIDTRWQVVPREARWTRRIGIALWFACIVIIVGGVRVAPGVASAIGFVLLASFTLHSGVVDELAILTAGRRRC